MVGFGFCGYPRADPVGGRCAVRPGEKTTVVAAEPRVEIRQAGSGAGVGAGWPGDRAHDLFPAVAGAALPALGSLGVPGLRAAHAVRAGGVLGGVAEEVRRQARQRGDQAGRGVEGGVDARRGRHRHQRGGGVVLVGAHGGERPSRDQGVDVRLPGMRVQSFGRRVHDGLRPVDHYLADTAVQAADRLRVHVRQGLFAPVVDVQEFQLCSRASRAPAARGRRELGGDQERSHQAHAGGVSRAAAWSSARTGAPGRPRRSCRPRGARLPTAGTAGR